MIGSQAVFGMSCGISKRKFAEYVAFCATAMRNASPSMINIEKCIAFDDRHWEQFLHRFAAAILIDDINPILEGGVVCREVLIRRNDEKNVNILALVTSSQVRFIWLMRIP